MQNEAEAEDVMQETFINAFKAIDKFEGRSGLGTWLYRIAHNAAMMRLRKPQKYFLSVEETLEQSQRVAWFPNSYLIGAASRRRF